MNAKYPDGTQTFGIDIFDFNGYHGEVQILVNKSTNTDIYLNINWKGNDVSSGGINTIAYICF